MVQMNDLKHSNESYIYDVKLQKEIFQNFLQKCIKGILFYRRESVTPCGSCFAVGIELQACRRDV
jgi:hypothetical protein